MPPIIVPAVPLFLDPIPTIIPFGSVTLFAGASGVGKTALLAEWCRRFRDGEPICGHATNKPTAIGYLAADRKWKSHQKWFDAVGFADIPHHSLRDQPTKFPWGELKNPKAVPGLFRNALESLQLPPGALVMVDPMSLFVGSLMDYLDTAIGLATVGDIAEEFQYTLLGVMHVGKQKGNKKDRYLRPQDRIIGSAALGGFTDTQIYIMSPEEIERSYYAVGWVPHHAKPETFYFIREESTGLFIPLDEDKLVQADTIATPAEVLLELIPFEATRTRDICDKAQRVLNMAETTFKRHLRVLVDSQRVKRPAQGEIQRVKPS